ncbi:ATP-binding cassette domain-containing protein [Aestuariirhabdus litorea]|uniref:ATP-binding cassette domain-containing protein n=1 Tax=Aestuariirhabdus litorea TaxID=2528527 RepID=A0A3P3VP10_9GAMM|nr:ATP-binding cassette domain-containing protein [Aestuariirhabdus litorea]RRJ84154.1 ATP-binding cassette domain-containing protein [Aestuariirhabdus litorea]RWW97374.1 ATP-binding cassette domain-containing protein [Endozoicomonadaceae bacterium GTF-13]
MPPSAIPAQGDATPVISMTGVTFAWPGQASLLDIERLEIAAGERVLIRGPSGSGKTSLLGLLGGVLLPNQGSISVLGHPLETLGNAERDHLRSDHIGYIFQMFNLLPYLSLVENVVLPTRFSGRRKERALGSAPSLQAEALRLLEHLGLGGSPDLLDKPVSALSIGQQQRVAAARALIGAPELLIADEPTSALDADSRERFLRLLFDECAAAHSTLLFVSHDRSLEPLFSRVIDLPQLNRAHPRSTIA